MKTEYLLDKEVDRVLAALTPQNRLIMRTALATGLRISDVLALTPDKLQRNCWVKEKKTGKKRQIGFPEPLLSDLRRAAGKTWVFEGQGTGKPKTRQAVWADVKRAQKAFRLDANIGPHSARKIYAVELLKQYGDIEKVRRALNHDSVTVTLIYAMADKLLQAKNQRRRPAPGRKKV